MKIDSLKSAIYASGVFSNGPANYQNADNIVAFQGSLHRSNNFGIFQAYYGANLSLGSYHVSEFYMPVFYYGGYSRPDSMNHIYNSNKFFGSYGVSGGINLAVTRQPVSYTHLTLPTILRV